MKDIKRKIAALGVASTLLTTAVGCENSDRNELIQLRHEFNEETKQEELIGKVSIEGIKKMYILKLDNNVYGYDNIYLCYATYQELYSTGDPMICHYNEFYANTELVKYEDKTNEYSSEYGTVKSFDPLINYIMYYNHDLKSEYSADEINELFERIKKDYKSNNEQNVLKKTISE